MAWSLTSRYENHTENSSANVVSGSFTPAADAMLMAIMQVSTDGNISSITGHDGGASWVQVYSVDAPYTGRDWEVWACFTGASPSAGTVTISRAYQSRFTLCLIEIDETTNGVDVSGTVANALGTFQNDAAFGSGTRTISLASFANANNLTMCAFKDQQADNLTSFEAGFTAMTFSDGSGNGFVEPWYLASEDTSITANVGGGYNGIWGVEVKQSAGAASVGQLTFANQSSSVGIGRIYGRG